MIVAMKSVLALLLLSCSAEAKIPANCKLSINGVSCVKIETKKTNIRAATMAATCHNWVPVFGGLVSSGANDTYLHLTVQFIDAATGTASGKTIDVRMALDGSAVLGPQNEKLEVPVSSALLNASISNPSAFQIEIDSWNSHGLLNSYQPN
jgi:hypothetical protein